MQKNFNFDNSYLSLSNIFYNLEQPTSFVKPQLTLINSALSENLNLNFENNENLISIINNSKNTYAQAYAGHQFGYFTKLGDGRAIMIGEHLTHSQKRFDIQLKGSGKTIYSRGGDGKATFKAMLREYIMSEAMHYLNIPTSRTLAVIKTGDLVFREKMQDGAAILRVMKSHIRVGTFEYARHFGTTDDLKALTRYTIKRLYPEILKDENIVISFLEKVIQEQIDLVVNWMRVGFIHGVMNTDNTSISGETFDFGPCAFINTYHHETVFSSIDQNSRYAFGNQARIIKWNLSRFAETLLPIIHENGEMSLKLAQNSIDNFDEIWHKKYYGMMLKKIGIENNTPENYHLVDEFLEIMKNLKLDYTHTFLALSNDFNLEENPINKFEFKSWFQKWKNTIDNSNGILSAKELMKTQNPVFIPRNHKVEQALEEANNGDFSFLEKFLNILKQPYRYNEENKSFLDSPDMDFDKNYQTFCGT